MSLAKTIDNYLYNAFTIDEGLIAYKKRRFNHNFQTFLPSDPFARMLDIGPGLGEILSLWKDKGYHNIEGIDIASSVVDFCNSRGLNCTLVHSSQRWLQEHVGTYDVITMLDVMEHVPKSDIENYLDLLYSALKDGGLAIVMVPNVHASEGFLHCYNDITHEIGFTPHTIMQLLSSSQFSQYAIFPFEEYCENDPSVNRIRQVRNQYWRILKMMRRLTHNIESEIITPEVFAIMVKNAEKPMSKPIAEFELENDFPSFDTLMDVLQGIGASNELLRVLSHVHQGLDLAFQNEDKTNKLQKNISGLQQQYSELRESLELLRGNISDLQQQYSELQKNLEILRATHEQLKQSVDSIQLTFAYRLYKKLASLKIRKHHV